MPKATRGKGGRALDARVLSTSFGGGAVSKLDQDKVLQAVILADIDAERFMPLTADRPPILLPVVHQPILEYMLECLQSSQVQETYIVCRRHEASVQEYLTQSRWNRPNSAMRIRLIVARDVTTVGDALRELDHRAIFHNDFILMTGCAVATVPIAQALREHKLRREKDKNAILTAVMRKVCPGHRARPVGDDAVVFLDHTTNEFLAYEPLLPGKARVAISLEELMAHPTVQIRHDLIDTHIYICSPDVAMLFTENFDYQDIGRDFIRGLIQSEILSNTTHAHIFSEGYAAYIQSFRTYDAVCRDVIQGWASPLGPESSADKAHNYTLSRGHIYRDQGVRIEHGAVLGKNCAIGARTTIGEGSKVSNSVIGPGCVIGKNVVIERSYIMDGVVIEDNCVVRSAVIGSRAALRHTVRVQPHSVLGHGVIVGPDVELAATARLIARTSDVATDDEDSGTVLSTSVGSAFSVNSEIDLTIVGEEGNAVPYVDEDDYSSDDENEHIRVALLPFVDVDVSEVTEEDLQEASEDELEEDDMPEESTSDFELFKQELHATVARSVGAKISADNTLVEINGLKYAYDASFRDCYTGVLQELLNQIELLTDGPVAAKRILDFDKQLRAVGKTWGQVLRTLIGKKHMDQLDALHIIVAHCAAVGGIAAAAFSKILQVMYDLDILEEDPIVKWYNTASDSADSEAEKQLVQRAAKFVEWLQEAEEEDDDDDDD